MTLILQSPIKIPKNQPLVNTGTLIKHTTISTLGGEMGRGIPPGHQQDNVI